MTNEEFLQQFGHFIDAPNGIIKLREIVYTLAMQGILISHNHGNEEATLYLERIQVAKDKVIRDKKSKKAKRRCLST